MKIWSKLSIIKIFQKVFSVFKNGQKKMSIFEKLKKVLKKAVFFSTCDQNAHKTKILIQKSVTIKFLYFF